MERSDRKAPRDGKAHGVLEDPQAQMALTVPTARLVPEARLAPADKTELQVAMAQPALLALLALLVPQVLLAQVLLAQQVKMEAAASELLL